MHGGARAGTLSLFRLLRYRSNIKHFVVPEKKFSGSWFCVKRYQKRQLTVKGINAKLGTCRKWPNNYTAVFVYITGDLAPSVLNKVMKKTWYDCVWSRSTFQLKSFWPYKTKLSKIQTIGLLVICKIIVCHTTALCLGQIKIFSWLASPPDHWKRSRPKKN